jgi:cytochrome c553
MKTAILTLMVASTMMMASNGADLYSKCASCHGSMGEKKALGKSKVINTMTEEEIVIALKGYKDGSYGGAMKGLMKGQVSKLADNDISTLAAHITNLKK